jgi:hypothetical protein
VLNVDREIIVEIDDDFDFGQIEAEDIADLMDEGGHLWLHDGWPLEPEQQGDVLADYGSANSVELITDEQAVEYALPVVSIAELLAGLAPKSAP